MEGVIAVFIPIVFLLATAGTITFYMYSRSKERALMIEKGIPLPEPKEENSKPRRTWLKLGILAIFVALGGVISNLIPNFLINDIYLIVLFGGIGLVVGHLWEKKELAKELENEMKNEMRSRTGNEGEAL